MNFFIEINPPTVTAQEHKVKVLGGKPLFYDTPEIKAAKALLMGHLSQHKPKDELYGAISLRVLWLFPRGRHKNGEWRVTKPDTDNLQKLLKWVDNTEYQTILEKRYLCFMTWEQIAVDLSYSIHHLYKLHNAALDICDRLMERDT